MAIPEGYVPLGLVGFTDQGDYKSNVPYMQNDLVHVNNSIWKCKADNTIGIVPAENASWTIFISSTTSLNGITAVDTKGIMGGAGEIVVSQALIDALATKVMESIPMNKIVNHFLATDPTTVLSGPTGKTLKDQVDKVNSDFINRYDRKAWINSYNFTATNKSGAVYLFIIARTENSEGGGLIIGNTVGGEIKIQPIVIPPYLSYSTNGMTVIFSSASDRAFNIAAIPFDKAI